MLNKVLIGILGLVVAIQLVPYGRNHYNPAKVQEPAWDSPETRKLVVRACFDCHSNETVWPWYSQVAPVSWLVQHDVEEGRAVLNFSEFNRAQEETEESAETVAEGEMPMPIYTWLHSEARLTEEEKTRLIEGLQATFGSEAEEDEEHP
jgi:mono/diheme cytochrome c family protein